MHVVDEGKGRAVVFLHGWGGSSASFAFVAASFKRSFRTVRCDLAGFGETPAPEEAWGAYEYADDVKRALNAIGIERCILVCHSFGGRVGIALSTRYPAFVSAIVLADSAGIRPKLTLKQRVSQARYKRAKKRGRAAESAGSDDYRSAGKLRPTFVRLVNEDMTDDLKFIGCPTLLVWGRDDSDTPMYMAKLFAKRIRGSGLVVLDGGHFAYLENPQTFVRVLDSFFSAVKEG